MPLESYTGRTVEALLARARQRLGPDAEIVAVRTQRGADGTSIYQVLASDAATAETERRHMAPDGGSHPLLRASPAGHEFARQRVGDRGPRLVAFVGPTGVGKTTTIAKLATHPEFLRKRAVGLLCLDTYRVGAVEQIRTYAEIAQLPLEVIYDASDLPGALTRLAPCDVVLIDTPGRGPRLQSDTQQIRQWLMLLAPSEVHLVLPAGLQQDYVRRAMESHRVFGFTHLLPTKLDEAPDDWTLFDCAALARIPMRWMSDGQEVPRDLKPAASRLLAAVAARRVETAEPVESLS